MPTRWELTKVEHSAGGTVITLASDTIRDRERSAFDLMNRIGDRYEVTRVQRTVTTVQDIEPEHT